MTLSPADVEGKTFSTALRGYDLDEVDDFLDEVVATLRDMSDQLAAAQQAPAPAVPIDRSVVGEGPDEGAVGRALIAAQQTADQIIADARREADRIIKEADTEADLMVSERDQRKADAEAEMALLTEHVSGVRSQLAVLATAVADRLDEMDEAIGLPEGMTGDDDESNFEDTETEDDDQSFKSRGEAGRHAGAREHGDDEDDVPNNVEELILDDRDAELEDADVDDGSGEDAAGGSDRSW